MGARRIVIEFLGKDVSAGKTAKQVEGKYNKLQGGFKKFGIETGIGLAGAGIAAVAFGKSTIRAASEAQQSLGGTQAVFGKFADAVIAKSKKAADAFGLSANEYRNSANIIGSLLKNQGVSQDKLGKSTDNMIKLGSDLAATYGGTTKDAVEALASAYKGEFDPLEQFGISLKQSAINSEALKVANVKSTAAFNKLTPAQQKAAQQQATQNLLMKQAAPAQGQFAKQTETLAEKTQIAGAKFENLKATLGEKLLPIAAKVTDWATKAIAWMDKHQKLVKGIALAVVPLVTALYLFAKAQAAVNLVMSLNPIGLVVLAIAGLVAGLVIAYKKSETFRDIVNGVFGAVAKTAKWLWEHGIRPYFKFIIDLWLNVVGGIINGAAKAFGWVPGLGPKLKTAAAWFNGFKKDVNDQLDGIHDKKIKVTTPGADAAINNLKAIKGLIHDITTSLPKRGSKNATSLTQLLDGGRAAGGPVSAGGAYLVGERGPEILKMGSQSGSIVPNHRIAAGSGGGTTVNVHFHGLVTNPQAVAKEIEQLFVKYQRTSGRPLAFI